MKLGGSQSPVQSDTRSKLLHRPGPSRSSQRPCHRDRPHMDDQGCAGAVHRQGGLGSRLGRAMGCPAWLHWRGGGTSWCWRWRGRGGWVAAAGRGGQRLVLQFNDVAVVDVLVVQVVDVGSSSSWTRLSSCPLLCKTGVWSRQCSPWS